MVASPRPSAPTSLSYIALVTWGTLMWKPLWQSKEQVSPSRQTEIAKVVWSKRRVEDSLCLLSTRMSAWGRLFLQAQWSSPGKVWWCSVQGKVNLLMTLGMSSRPAIYSCWSYFHNSGDEHHTVWEHGSPLQKRNSLLWTSKQELGGLVLKMVDRQSHKTMMATSRRLFGLGENTPNLLSLHAVPYW